MTETCVTPRLSTKESNRRANERKKEAWQAKGNVTQLYDDNMLRTVFMPLLRWCTICLMLRLVRYVFHVDHGLSNEL